MSEVTNFSPGMLDVILPCPMCVPEVQKSPIFCSGSVAVRKAKSLREAAGPTRMAAPVRARSATRPSFSRRLLPYSRNYFDVSPHGLGVRIGVGCAVTLCRYTTDMMYGGST